MASPPSTQDVLDALRPIIDPDFHKSIVDLGFIKNLKIDGSRVGFDIELPTPACPVKAEFENAARERVLALPGFEKVAVEMTALTRGRTPRP
ncbi:MAG: iron-sulfur cluster assembly protein, partial [Myxococcales bacterium]|nr:iron-sulfur cluster assembly protein [Myxococcales bacterium]